MPDPQFNRAKSTARLDELRTKGQAHLEQMRAHFLAADFQPNLDWWGSAMRDAGFGFDD